MSQLGNPFSNSFVRQKSSKSCAVQASSGPIAVRAVITFPKVLCEISGMAPLILPDALPRRDVFSPCRFMSFVTSPVCQWTVVESAEQRCAMKLAIVGLILVCAASASAQKLDVKIADRQDKEDEYDYAAVFNNVAIAKAFKVRGATFTLQLPDGRGAVVNCESKFAEHMAGRAGNRRSCRVPLVDNIQADFNGDNAKLIWPVSLDGNKMQSETYKILAILDKPQS